MSRSESLKKYETIVIFNPDLNEGALKTEIARVEGLITTNQGRNLVVAPWGRKEIAYLVKGQKFGHFVYMTFEGENSELIDSLNNVLRITESVLKFQTHRIATRHRKFKGSTKRRDSGDDLGLPEVSDF